jgi:alkylation response protein AidB-like acyl-CoA dehydrogenase
VSQPEGEREIIGFGLPMSSDGVTIDETWDALGMRATGSHDVILDDVFVADAQITARRPWDRLDAPLIVALAHAIPIISAVYLGVLTSIRDAAVSAATGKSDLASIHLAGQLDTACQSARWNLVGALADLGPDPAAELHSFTIVQQAKHAVLTAGRDIIPAGMELVGGAAYRKGHHIERAVRDSLASTFHPVGPEATLIHVGQSVLGLDATRL